MLFADLIEGRIGTTFSYKRAVAPFASRQEEHGSRTFKALTAYLFRLRERGYVDFQNDGYMIRDEILVLADLSNPPAPRRA